MGTEVSHMRVWVRSAGLVALASCGALSKPAFGQQMGDAPTITPTRFNGKPTTGWPGPRGGHTLTALSGGRFLMVGGTEGGDGTALNSIFELDTTKMHWRALPDSSTKSLPASIGHQAVQADSGVVCFGGTTGKQELNGFWKIVSDEQTEWNVVKATGVPHPARLGHAMAVIPSEPHTLWLFGGLNQSIKGRANAVSTLSAFDVRSGSWSEHTTAVAPCARAAHTAVGGERSQILVFGGVDYKEKRKLNDVNVFDTRTGCWELDLPTTGDQPSPRSGHCAVMMGANHMLIFGGIGADGTTLGDAYVLDIEASHWSKAEFAAGTQKPSARFGGAMVAGGYEQERHVVWLYGGSESPETSWFQFFGGKRIVPCDDLFRLEISV